MREGSEEYLDSKEYELRSVRSDGPLLPMVQRLNRQYATSSRRYTKLSSVTFLETANDALIAYAKASGPSAVICVVNVDPHQPQEGVATVPASLGLAPTFTVKDELSGERYQWRIGPNYVRLEPGSRQAHVLSVRTLVAGPPTLTHLLASERARRPGREPAAEARPRPTSGSRPSRCGSSARSSTRSIFAGSTTPTATARATCAG